MWTECEQCGQTLRDELVAEYEEELLGLNGVVLIRSVHRRVCDGCGECLLSIPNLTGLIAAVALVRAMQPWPVAGKDIAFLRQAMELTGRELAEALGVAPESLSRWENDKQPMSATAEKALRLMVVAVLCSQAPALGIDDKCIRTLAGASMASLRAAESGGKLLFQLVPSASSQGSCWVLGQRLAA